MVIINKNTDKHDVIWNGKQIHLKHEALYNNETSLVVG